MREIKYTTRFKRDYRREKTGRHRTKLDVLLMEVVNLLAADTALPRRNFDHPLSVNGAITATATLSPSSSLIYRDNSLELVCALVLIASLGCEAAFDESRHCNTRVGPRGPKLLVRRVSRAVASWDLAVTASSSGTRGAVAFHLFREA
jgi:mRNA interferase YafQ